MLTKAEMIAAVAEATETSKNAAGKAFDAVFDVIAQELIKGEKVSIHGFGTFTVKQRSARKGRNPQTGKEITIPAKKVVGFKASTSVRDKLK